MGTRIPDLQTDRHIGCEYTFIKDPYHNVTRGNQGVDLVFLNFFRRNKSDFLRHCNEELNGININDVLLQGQMLIPIHNISY